MDYNFEKESVNLTKLDKELRVILPNIYGVSFGDGHVTIHSPELLPEEIDLATSAIANHVATAAVPESVTPRQIRMALIMAGYSLAVIDGAIASLPEPQQSLARVTWEYSTVVYRNNPLIASLTPIIGITESQIDDLFIAAGAIP